MKHYNVEHFNKARTALLLPHPEGLNVSIGQAFQEYGIAIDNFDHNLLDDSSQRWVNKLNSYRDNFDLLVKLSIDQMVEISSLIDELADWALRASYDNLK
jgi:hypothetical protein